MERACAPTCRRLEEREKRERESTPAPPRTSFSLSSPRTCQYLDAHLSTQEVSPTFRSPSL